MPVENGEKRLELSLEDNKTVLKLSSWVNGLGWCGQKTMEIDDEMLEEMHRLLGAARVRVRSRQEGPEPEMRKVLRFPTAA